MTVEATLPLRSRDGRIVGQFTVTCLQRSEKWRDMEALIDFQSDPSAVSPEAAVQLLEELSYEYVVTDSGTRTVTSVHPADLFSAAKDSSRGRLEVHRATGTLAVEVHFHDGTTGTCDLEVRSRKLNYQTDYRSMLLRIARESAELVQSAFAPSSLPAFQPEQLHDPETVYQRFAFIQALLESEGVRDALHLVQRRPHSQHESLHRIIDPARASRTSASLSRQLVASGPRQRTTRPIAGLNTLPRRISEVINETTFDTVPNRFVRYVLTRWLGIANDVERVLNGPSPSERRGRREAQLIAAELELVLSSPALRDAGRLTSFPHANPVLHGRAGYREIFEAFLLAEAAATINWEERDRLFSAGQRNVAELYEYWVFLELVRIVESLQGFAVDKRSLVRQSKQGLTLELRRGQGAVVTATGIRRGTPVEIRMWFNKQFERGKSDLHGSWTVSMRPDCSIQILPKGRALNADTWVHFDAKYRIDDLTYRLDEAIDQEESSLLEEDQRHRPVSGDLAKMHAYRDAIRRTAGAYVLYPGRDGTDPVRHKQYHEILPGLGAFALRPTDDGESSAGSSAGLAAFLESVIDHVAAQGTSAERARYWTAKSYKQRTELRLDHTSNLTKPPEDTMVLLGFVKSQLHLDWILTNGLYNLRADSSRAGSVAVDAPELAADFLLLYDATSEATIRIKTTGVVVLQSSVQLRSSGYPDPGGDHYFCLEIDAARPEDALGGSAARDLGRRCRDPHDRGAPTLVTWADLENLQSGKVR